MLALFSICIVLTLGAPDIMDAFFCPRANLRAGYTKKVGTWKENRYSSTIQLGEITASRAAEVRAALKGRELDRSARSCCFYAAVDGASSGPVFCKEPVSSAECVMSSNHLKVGTVRGTKFVPSARLEQEIGDSEDNRVYEALMAKGKATVSGESVGCCVESNSVFCPAPAFFRARVEVQCAALPRLVTKAGKIKHGRLVPNPLISEDANPLNDKMLEAARKSIKGDRSSGCCAHNDIVYCPSKMLDEQKPGSCGATVPAFAVLAGKINSRGFKPESRMEEFIGDSDDSNRHEKMIEKGKLLATGMPVSGCCIKSGSVWCSDEMFHAQVHPSMRY